MTRTTKKKATKTPTKDPVDPATLGTLVEPDDLIPLGDAAEKYGFRYATLTYRIAHGSLTGYKKKRARGEQGPAAKLFVSEADMKNQPPVTNSTLGRKRPDVAARYQTAGKRPRKPYTRKGVNTNGNAGTQINEQTIEDAAAQAFDRHLCYAFGRVQAWLDIYASSISAPAAVLAGGVGRLLQNAESGSPLGSVPKLPHLR